MDHRRKDCMTVEEITGCFDKLRAVMEKYSINWKDIFNMDEIGFRVGCIKSTTVITHKNIKQASVTRKTASNSMIDRVLTGAKGVYT